MRSETFSEQLDEPRKDEAAVVFSATTLRPSEAISVPVSLCDVSADPMYVTLMPFWCHRAAAVMLVYDVTSVSSFAAAEEMATQLLDGRAPGQVFMLVGTKSDTPEPHAVTAEQGRAFASLNDMLFIEVSAQSGLHVGLSFALCAKAVRQRAAEQQSAVSFPASPPGSPGSPPAVLSPSPSSFDRPARRNSRPSLRKSSTRSLRTTPSSSSDAASPPAHWARDEDVTHCAQCRHKFSAVLRKHHCRTCGNIFCVHCSGHRNAQRQRICDGCFAKE